MTCRFEPLLLRGDARALPLTDQSVQCVVTSPPYWGLRDYRLLPLVWGGQDRCEHQWGTGHFRSDKRGVDGSTLAGTLQPEARRLNGAFQGQWCLRCSAWRGSLGLEPTPGLYVQHLVEVFREVRRVLRDDGTVWLNLGDSYATSGGGSHKDWHANPGLSRSSVRMGNDYRERHDGLKLKDLVGIPWSAAKALQAPYYVGRIKAESDRAWLAGFLDGEGTITFVERDRGEGHTSTHDVRVFFTNCDNASLRHFAEMTAGHVYQHEDGDRENRYGSRPCFRWQMGTHDGALLLRELYPYLRTKRRQAALVWTLYTTLRHKSGHARTPDNVIKKRQAIAHMVRSLNAGRAVDLPDWVEEPPSCYELGWYLRSDIIWAKLNPMPESVTDRPTRAHEYLFLLSKSERYYYDATSIAEPVTWPETKARIQFSSRRAYAAGVLPSGNEAGKLYQRPTTRNHRSVWVIPTQPYKGAHFATFPEKLVEPCILAGTSEGGACTRCGTPWVRVTRHRWSFQSESGRSGNSIAGKQPPVQGVGYGDVRLGPTIETKTLGWRPSCRCVADTRSCVVLDPFVGSGTVCAVAARLGRRSVGVDLKPEYLQLAVQRVAGVVAAPVREKQALGPRRSTGFNARWRRRQVRPRLLDEARRLAARWCW